MRLSRNNAGIVSKAIVFQLGAVPPDTVLSSHIEITRLTAHFFIPLHGLMMKSLNPGCRIDLFLSIWVTERRVEAQIRAFFNYRSKSTGEIVL